jgi:tRNA G46 methylase TrmB
MNHSAHFFEYLLLWLVVCFTTLITSHGFMAPAPTWEPKYPYTDAVCFSSRLSEHTKIHYDNDTVHHMTLLSQDHIDQVSELVERRATARWEGNFNVADDIRNQLLGLEFLADHHLSILLHDIPRKDGGGSFWSLVRRPDTQQNQRVDAASVSSSNGGDSTVLQLAHAALGLAISSSEQACLVDTDLLQTLVNQALDRLQLSSTTSAPASAMELELELGGRKAADAAFWFALAGSSNDELLHRLADIAAEELQRFGARESCRPKDVWQILERFAAAGLRQHSKLSIAAISALTAKKEDPTKFKVILDFFSDRCLVMIWKFSTRQRKQRVFLEMARNHWVRDKAVRQANAVVPRRDSEVPIDWAQIYGDPTKPLVIDIGCGMGVSILGLAQQQQEGTSDGINFPWSECNFAGVDLSGLAISYARSLGILWKLDVHFYFESAESLIQNVLESYPGSVRMCMIQFPTPYRLSAPHSAEGDIRGNTQLPASAKEGFMVSENLLHLVNEALVPGGTMLVQSNCEDVAVWIRNTATNCCNFETVDLKSSIQDSEHSIPTKVTKRTLDWIAMGGERAHGREWSVAPLLPRKGRTETEVACMLNGTPVHRCLLIKPVKNNIEMSNF